MGFFVTYDGQNTWQVAIVGLNQGSSLIFAYSDNSMIPNKLEMGQELFGTNGAQSASFADYTELTYYDGFVLHIGGPWITTTTSSQNSDSPPFFTWIHLPSQQEPGEFHTKCC